MISQSLYVASPGFPVICRLYIHSHPRVSLHTDKSADQVPDEVCGLSTLHLAVKYNEVVKQMLEIAQSHHLTKEVMEAKDIRGFNILQFSTLNCFNNVHTTHQTLAMQTAAGQGGDG